MYDDDDLPNSELRVCHALGRINMNLFNAVRSAHAPSVNTRVWNGPKMETHTKKQQVIRF